MGCCGGIERGNCVGMNRASVRLFCEAIIFNVVLVFTGFCIGGITVFMGKTTLVALAWIYLGMTFLREYSQIRFSKHVSSLRTKWGSDSEFVNVMIRAGTDRISYLGSTVSVYLLRGIAFLYVCVCQDHDVSEWSFVRFHMVVWSVLALGVYEVADSILAWRGIALLDREFIATRRNDKMKFLYAPNYAVPPGGTLEETIEQMGLTVEQFAEKAGLDSGLVHDVLQGDAEITEEMAGAFERVSGVPAELWLSLERNYQRNLVRLQLGE
jgi:addiction module HigA family antidote